MAKRPPRRLEDTIMTTEQKIIRAKVGHFTSRPMSYVHDTGPPVRAASYDKCPRPRALVQYLKG